MVHISKLLSSLVAMTRVLAQTTPFSNDEVVFKITDQKSDVDLSKLNYESDLSQIRPETLFDAPHFKPLLDLHRNLIEIDSVSEGETSVAAYLASYLRDLGLTVEVQELQGENFDSVTSNVYAYIGSNRDTKILMTSHIDTVPPFFNYSIEGSQIYGRGSVDAKNCVAGQVAALVDLWQNEAISEGDLSLLFVVGEETSGRGAKYARQHLGVTSWESIIFGEPTEGKLGVGHKGMLTGDIEVFGKTAHSGYPHLGISATDILVDILYHLKKEEKNLPQGKLLGNSTINLGHLEGGLALNVVADYAKASVAIRIGEDLEYVRKTVIDIVEKYGGEYAKLTWGHFLALVECDFDVPGFETAIMAYGTDIPNFGTGDFKRYLYGSGSIHVAHSAREYVKVDDLISSVNGYKRLVTYRLDN